MFPGTTTSMTCSTTSPANCHQVSTFHMAYVRSSHQLGAAGYQTSKTCRMERPMFVPDLKASRSSSMDVPNLNPGPLGNQVSMGLGRFIEIISSTCLFVSVFLSLFLIIMSICHCILLSICPCGWILPSQNWCRWGIIMSSSVLRETAIFKVTVKVTAYNYNENLNISAVSSELLGLL